MDRSPWNRGLRDTPDTLSDPIAPEASQDVYDDLEVLDGAFAGQRGAVFGLAAKTGVLTVLTLGIYRFWMKTRLRRWYWSSVRVGGVPAEYVGDPLEKLLGFLIAVAFLAFYIGIVNLLLMFLSFSFFEDSFVAYLLSFAGVVPLWFYARYRARRYVLGRTRWRGIRFGLDQGAWGYAGRALLHWGLTILSLGLLWPRMTFLLEKYKTDRTWFGNTPLEQDGRWTLLYPATKHVAIALVIGAVAAVLLVNDNIWGITLACIATCWLGYGVVFYRVRCWEILTNHKRAGDIVLRATPRPGRVFWIYVLGYGLSGFVASVLLVPLVIVGLAFVGGVDALANGQLEQVSDWATWMLTLISVGFYFAVFLAWGAMTHAFVTMPLWRHYAETLTVIHPGSLDRIAQRDRDAFAEAEGFAEALDLGGAI
ncbi:DUF898 family protein [Shimia sp. SDUM112013]|uniref:YjgN family protein n=1 Tax=Shimia sp. SDUM112013 TaxID=3136160 RepID=UPI0032ECC514